MTMRPAMTHSAITISIWLLSLWMPQVINAVQTSKLQVLVPQTLAKQGGYDHRDALFGVPPYGGSLQQQVFYSDSSDCDDIDPHGGYPQRSDGSAWKSPYILLVDRGGCSFVQKVRNAQKIGASAVLIADDMCLCDHEACVTEADEICETVEPLMADDGSGSDISIPSFLVFKEDADEIKKALKNNQHVRVQMSFKVPAPDARVEYELWTSPSDPASRPIEEAFGAAALALGQHAAFTPHLYIYDGVTAGCQIEGQNLCDNLCTNNGLYCSVDPDEDLENGASGADVVVEALRRICIWKQYGEADGVGEKWWKYLTAFISTCDKIGDDYDTSPSKFNDQQCIDQAMASAGVNKHIVNTCMTESGEVGENANGTNTILDKEISDQANSGVVLIPSLLVNGAVIRGSLSFSTVFKAVCSGYSTGSKPTICSECANCHDEMQCVLDGYCPAAGDGSGGGVPLEYFVATLVGLSFMFGFLTVLQYRRQQRLVHDQVRGIVQEYMPVTSQNSRLGTSVALEEDRPDGPDGPDSPEENGKSSFTIT